MGQIFRFVGLTFVTVFAYDFTKEYPTYVISLANDDKRREYMEMTYGNHLHFVEAVNGRNSTNLIEHFVDLAALGSVDSRDVDWYIKNRTGATKGELGNTASLLKAMELALQNLNEYALILEDDVSDSFKYLWPAPLSSYVEYANRNYPGWHNIRLEWGLHRPLMNIIKRSWYNELRRRASNPLTLGAHYGKLTGKDDQFPLVLPSSNGWGTVAVLWSRRGLKYITNQMRSESTSAKWRCPTALRCISDNFLWRMSPQNLTLLTTPPLIGCSLAESSTGEIQGRAGGDHSLTHTSITVTNLHWLVEAYEALQPRKSGTWPPQLQYSVGNATWS